MISVIIPTLNAAAHLPNLLQALGRQSFPCEIIVVDSSSDDETREIAGSSGATVIKIPREDFDHGSTRNAAARAASGSILVFLTQDALPADPEMISNLVMPLQDKRVALSYGRQIPRQGATPVERFARAYNYPERPLMKSRDDVARLGIKAFFCSSVCMAIRRETFREVKGFPEGIIMNEDMAMAGLCLLRGYQVAYEASASVYHSHDYALRRQFRRYFDIGASFTDNWWILLLARPEGEGMKFLKEEIRFLIRERNWRWIPYGVLDAAVRYSGYVLGRHHEKIPVKLKKCLSMHQNFWVRQAASGADSLEHRRVSE